MAATTSSWSPPSFTRKIPSTASFPDTSTIPTLHGKSNFTTWQSAILTPLTSNPHSNDLLFGGWSDTVSPTSTYAGASRSPSPTSAYFSPISSPTSNSSSKIPPSPSPSHLYASFYPSKPLANLQTNHHAHELANLQTSRFIRATLAMNVVPFVRQHVSARALWEQLLYLYGECCGIDMVGGPAVFGVIDMKGVKLDSIPRLQKNFGKVSNLAMTVRYEVPVVSGMTTPNTKSRRPKAEDTAASAKWIRMGDSATLSSFNEKQATSSTPTNSTPSTNPASSPKHKKSVTFVSPFHFRKTVRNYATPNPSIQLKIPTTPIESSSSQNKASPTNTAGSNHPSLGKRRNKSFEMEMKSLVLNQDTQRPVGTSTEELENL